MANDTDTDTDTVGPCAEVEEAADVLDLRECGLEPSCEPIRFHNSPDSGDVTCARSLATEGDAGVLAMVYEPGPGGLRAEILSVLRGDGTVLTQTATHHFAFDDSCTEVTEIGPLQICEVTSDACGDPESIDCQFLPWNYPNCTDSDDLTCEDVRALIEPAP